MGLGFWGQSRDFSRHVWRDLAVKPAAAQSFMVVSQNEGTPIYTLMSSCTIGFRGLGFRGLGFRVIGTPKKPGKPTFYREMQRDAGLENGQCRAFKVLNL